MRLSSEWRRVWRRFSFNALGWGLAGIAGWQTAPQEFKDVIGPSLIVSELAICTPL